MNPALAQENNLLSHNAGSSSLLTNEVDNIGTGATAARVTDRIAPRKDEEDNSTNISPLLSSLMESGDI